MGGGVDDKVGAGVGEDGSGLGEALVAIRG